MPHIRFRFLSLFALILIMAAIAPVRAAADADDPPGRVARLGWVQGGVSFNPAGTDDWVDAVINRPMTTGDKLWSDRDSRAELHIGSASIRLSSNTGFSFLNLTDNMTQIQLTAGTVRIRVKRLGDDENFEVDTPNLAFSILRPGVYRVHVDDDGNSTIIKIPHGEGEVTGGGSAYTVHAREMGNFSGTDQLQADIESYQADDDDFERWCAERDHREDVSVSARYVSPDVIGYEDLDQYGGWRPVPEYGTVWFPNTTVVGWAPYHYGHWAYVAPWGYTWVDDAPWGFAPFHYGRWVFVGGAWGWVPAPPPAVGVVYVRPVYAPALVAWVGGPHFAVGVGGGGFAAGVSVGWFPLGPREVYVPSYPVSRTYVTNINVTNTTVNETVVNNYYNTTVVNKNVTVVHQTYVNQTVVGAVAATTPQAFTSAQPVARNVVRVDAREVASAPVNVATPAVAPPKQAVLGSGPPSRVRPPSFVQTRTVVAKTPPPPPPVAFERQQQAIQANGGKPIAVSQARQMQPQNAAARPNVKVAPQPTRVNGGNPAPNPANNNRPAPGANPSQQPASAGANANGNNGYQRFNDRPNSGQPAGNGAGNQPQPANRPPNQPSNAGSQPSNGAGEPANRQFNDRPPASRPSPSAPAGSAGSGANANSNAGNNNLDARHQQQQEQLRNQQDQERQKLQQQQQQERQNLTQQKADAAKVQQLNQQHQQQAEDLQKKHTAQQQQLQQKQQQERKDEGSKSKDDHK